MANCIGSWVATSELLISDPIYNSTLVAGPLKLSKVAKVISGRWTASIEYFRDNTNRIAYLLAEHADQMDGQWCEFHMIGVDSGLAGIFNLDAYPQNCYTGDCNNINSLYGKCCHITHHIGAGIVNYNGADMGIVSCSGYGYGGYYVNVKKNKFNEIIAIRIDYL